MSINLDHAVSFTSVPQMRVAVTNSGSHFFDKESVKFFNSKIESPIISGRFFITSEYMDDPADKRYTVRYFTQSEAHEMMASELVGEYREHETLAAAKSALREALGSAS